MREILFRGKRIHELSQNEHLDGEWVEGYLCNKNYINTPELEGGFLIDSETVCQYIGVNDKNGKKVYENDIVRREIFGDAGYIVGQVVYFDVGFCGFYFKYGSSYYAMGKDDQGKSEDEVIGNIFDNPEMLSM